MINAKIRKKLRNVSAFNERQKKNDNEKKKIEFKKTFKKLTS